VVRQIAFNLLCIHADSNQNTYHIKSTYFYALINDKTAAIENLKKAMSNGFENYNYLKHDPDLNSLQKEPDYIA
jgi:hypothetical protein